MRKRGYNDLVWTFFNVPKTDKAKNKIENKTTSLFFTC